MNRSTQRVIRDTARAAQAAAESAARSADATMRTIEQVAARAEQATRRTAMVTQQQTGDTGKRIAQIALGVSMASEQMSRMGTLGGEGLRQVLVQGGQLVALMGLGGPFTSALAVAALAIVNVFDTAKRKAAEATAAVTAELDRLQNAGQTAPLMAKARELQFGLPSKGLSQFSPGSFVGSINDLLGEQRTLEAEIARAGRTSERQISDVINFPIWQKRLGEVRTQLRGLIKEMEDLRQRILNVQQAQTPRGLMGVPVNITAGGAAGVASGAAAPAFTPGPLGAVAAPSLAGIGALNVTAGELPSFTAAREAIERDAAKLQETIRSNVEQGVGGALMSAFSAAFNGEGIGGILASFGRSVTQSMMQMFASFIAKQAAALQIWGSIASAFSTAFAALGPFAGPAAIAAGIGMLALARSLGGGAGAGMQAPGRFGAGAVPAFGAGGTQRYTVPSASAPAAVMASGANVERVPNVTINMTNIGWNEPAVERGIFLAYEGARKQGMGSAAMGSFRRQSGV